LVQIAVFPRFSLALGQVVFSFGEESYRILAWFTPFCLIFYIRAWRLIQRRYDSDTVEVIRLRRVSTYIAAVRNIKVCNPKAKAVRHSCIVAFIFYPTINGGAPGY
jgi:hypothetical protein